MQKVRFINSTGESILLSDTTPPFFLQRIEGTGGVDVDIQTEKSPYQDGATYIDSILNMRSIVLTVTIKARNAVELFELRSQLVRVFNPKLKIGVLEYETPTGTKIINAVSELAPVFANLTSGTVAAVINLLCPNPYWFDKDDHETIMSTPFPKLFSFPLTLGTEMGEEGNSGNFVNQGDVPTPLIFEISGAVKNPKIINYTTNEFIRIKKTINENEKIVINTSPFDRQITFVDANGMERNGFQWLDFDSEFFQLSVGENRLKYISDNSEDKATLNIKWHNRYVGV